MLEKKRINWTITAEAARQVRVQHGNRSTLDLSVQDIDVVFQPLVDLRTGRMQAVEALARCQWEEFKRPEVLIARAVEEDSIGRVGRLIREVAFDRCKGIPLFVNIDPNELAFRWLVRPDDPINFHDHLVFLEITEVAAFEHYGLCSSVLREVCSRCGAKLVIDDLGAGFSNLKRVIDLNPDVIKIDRAIVHGIDTNHRQRIIFNHVVRMCKELGTSVVAEGIETVDELKAVYDGGADYGQGFLLARPAFPIPEPVWPLPSLHSLQTDNKNHVSLR